MEPQDDEIEQLNLKQDWEEQQPSRSNDLDFWLTADFVSLNDDGLTDDIAAAALKYEQQLDISGLLASDPWIGSTIPAQTVDPNVVEQFLTSLNSDTPSISLSPNTTDEKVKKKQKSKSTLDDEEKRKRNTLASARFRQKKKAKEEAIAQQAKEMTNRVAMLEARIKEQDLEIKWLRKLVTERDLKKPEQQQPTVLASQIQEALSMVLNNKNPNLNGDNSNNATNN